ncbi:hypothetical protein JHK82_053098 [Glycine max]|nr:hypothetical protein JHK86_052944 [Glycine max]KAG4927317.1 hypothetical protein JHK85_053803 [Glycine max]KAG5085701.1 hypothetical protein JHK82_053098 [Glycine max]
MKNSSSSSTQRKCAFARKCARLVKEQRARFYIMRHCVIMLICWHDPGHSDQRLIGEIRGVQRVGLIKFKLENQPEIHLQLERVLGWAGAEFLVRLEREPLTLTVAPNLVGEEEGVDGSMWKLVASGDAGQRGIWRCRHWRGGTV